MLRRVLSDRRLWLLAAEMALVIVLARLVIPAGLGFGWVIHTGYWFTLGCVVLFLGALIPFVRGRWREFRFEPLDRLAVFLCLGFVAVWTAQERPGFKILADEVVLLGTSMGMHYEREASYPVRATDIQGPFQILNSVLDKRPLLFPFLVATVHDLTGYRPQNAFHLNMVLGVIFLGLAYLVGWSAGGQRWAGILVVLLFGGLPLMAQQAAGGGFELLNLLLIALVGLAMAWYLEVPEERRLEILVYAALLLACTRYESIVFLLPVAIAVIWGWVRAGRIFVTWRVALAPVFLLPLLLQNRVFAGQSGAWELASVGAAKPFGIEYFAVNLGHAIDFFFPEKLNTYQPSSQVFAVLGLLALPFFGLWIARVLRQSSRHAAREIAWALMGLGLFLVSTVYLLYFWGQFNHPVIRRLSLPVHFLFALAVVVIAALSNARSAAPQRLWRVLSLIAVVGLIFRGLPVMAQRAYGQSYSPGVEMELRQQFLARLPERDFLFLDTDSIFWIVNKVPASPIGGASSGERKAGLMYHLKNHSFSQIYVFQSILVDDQTGRRYVDPMDELGPDYELETIWEKRVQALLFARISRVVAIKGDGESVKATGALPVTFERRPQEEIDRGKALYLENWIKKLP